MKRILFVFPSLRISGAEKATIQIANELTDSYECSVSFFVFEDCVEQRDLISPKIIIHECKVSYTDVIRIKRIALTYFYFPNLLIKYLRKQKFDYIISVYEYFSEWAVISAKFFYHTEFKSVTAIHNSIRLTKKNSRFTRTLLFMFIDRLRGYWFDKVIIVADYLKNELKYIDYNKIFRIPNPIKIDDITKRADETTELENYNIEKKKYFLNIGRICEQKNQNFLLNAYIEISKNTDWKLIIVGNPQDEKIFHSLKQKIIENHLEERVIHLPKSAHIYSLIRHAGAYVCTSKFEGLSVAILESMALKTPILSVKYFGYQEALNEENSLLIENSNYHTFADRMLSYSRGEINLSAKVNNAFEAIRKNNNIEEIASEYFKMLQQ